MRCIVLINDKYIGKGNKRTSSKDKARVFYSKKQAKEEFPEGEIIEVILSSASVRKRLQVRVYHIEYLCPVTEDRFYGPYSDLTTAEAMFQELISNAGLVSSFEYKPVKVVQETGFLPTDGFCRIVSRMRNRYFETLMLKETILSVEQ